MTAIRSDDVINTLQSLNLIKWGLGTNLSYIFLYFILFIWNYLTGIVRYYKGQHIISVSSKVIEEHLKVLCVYLYMFPHFSVILFKKCNTLNYHTCCSMSVYTYILFFWKYMLYYCSKHTIMSMSLY